MTGADLDEVSSTLFVTNHGEKSVKCSENLNKC